MSEWKDAKTCKPESSTAMETKRVLVYAGFFGDMRIAFGWWNESSERWYIEGSQSEPDVTHWMPLPEGPK